ncbi:M81 family metallopeptidase [Paenibacillus sp. HJGM_3]|uniref:M81 family metallopeptidase n=1 Tax=Paenibacillus sp. HJGM_3 TaxID=3379816 RepID=UPI00385E4E33
MKIAVGGLIQESNTFSEAISTLDDFKRYFYRIGDQMEETLQAENELAGFYRAAREQEVTLIPTIFAHAVSSGKIGRRMLDELKAVLFEQLDRYSSYDGVLFALHGAWVAEDCDDADGEILSAIREKVGRSVPVVITLDSHANVTQSMVDQVDGLIGYRTFPHTDYAETGYRAAKLLFSIVRGEIQPSVRLKKVPMIVPAENHQTYRGPMAELWAEARQGEECGVSLATSLFAVQPWLDIAEMGCSAVVVGTDPNLAEEEADRLAAMMWSKRRQFEVALYTVPAIVELLADPQAKGPLVASDSADSPGAGSPGDSNFVLRELLALGAERRYDCLLSMVDGPAARKAVSAGAGRAVKLRVGHTISTSVGSAIDVEGVVAHVGNGAFRFGGGTVAGLVANMGQCAVVQIGRLSLLLMENPTFTGDPAMYRSVGLEPAEANFVLVKSANQFRAEYERLTDRIYILDTPGASTANLTRLPFRNIPRPMYPFDDSAFGKPAASWESTS